MYIFIRQSDIDEGVFVTYYSTYENAAVARNKFMKKCEEFCIIPLTAAIFKMDGKCRIPEVGK